VYRGVIRILHHEHYVSRETFAIAMVISWRISVPASRKPLGIGVSRIVIRIYQERALRRMISSDLLMVSHEVLCLEELSLGQ